MIRRYETPHRRKGDKKMRAKDLVIGKEYWSVFKNEYVTFKGIKKSRWQGNIQEEAVFENEDGQTISCDVKYVFDAIAMNRIVY